MVELCAKGLTVESPDGAELVASCDISLRGGTLVALIGPNGAGKSSLIRALAGACGYSGSAALDGREIAGMTPRERARRIAWLPQALPPAWPVSVRDAVTLGRFAYGAAPGRLASIDAQAVQSAMVAADVDRLAMRPITTLSGGELARVHLARALAAEADILLADEPAAALDLAHQWSLMRMLRAEAGKGRLVLVVVHDIDLAARWAERILVMAGGNIVADGATADVVTPDMLATIFGVEASVSQRDGHLSVAISGTVAAAAD